MALDRNIRRRIGIDTVLGVIFAALALWELLLPARPSGLPAHAMASVRTLFHASIFILLAGWMALRIARSVRLLRELKKRTR